MNGVIYALCEPFSEEVRYVGQTKKDPAIGRYYAHMSAAKNGAKAYVYNWIRTLDEHPKWKVLEQVEVDRLDEREQFWIDSYRERGARLTNLKDSSSKWPDGMPLEYRENLTRALKGRKCSATTRGKMRAAYNDGIRSDLDKRGFEAVELKVYTRYFDPRIQKWVDEEVYV